jgi:uncharacterized membrane protein
MGRVRAVDWLRGLVMVLMAIDHAGGVLDANHLHLDSAGGWTAGRVLPAGEFLTRWISHLCAPTFLLLAGVGLAFSAARRGDRPGETAFIVKRGLLILALDPLWMSLGFSRYNTFTFQVLYAIGLGLVCMAFLRRLPPWALLAAAVALQVGGEWLAGLFPAPFDAAGHFDRSLWDHPAPYLVGALLFNGGPLHPRIHTACGYPLVPWLSMMMAGWVLGCWLVARAQRPAPWRARRLALVGLGLLAAFAVVRGLDGYGNWGLHRDSLAPLQWLHVSKYPPSLAYTTLELGLAFVLLALLVALDDARPRRWLAPLGVLGATAFFFYLLHVHVLAAANTLLHVDRKHHGLLNTYAGAAAVLLALYPLCLRYRRYKAAHPDGWTRFL